MSLRTPSYEGCEKIPVGLSFSGTEGHKAYQILNKARDLGYSKSGLVVKLINIYGRALDEYGEDLAMYKLMEAINGSIKKEVE